jgi:hypothetical protein
VKPQKKGFFAMDRRASFAAPSIRVRIPDQLPTLFEPQKATLHMRTRSDASKEVPSPERSHTEPTRTARSPLTALVVQVRYATRKGSSSGRTMRETPLFDGRPDGVLERRI